MKALLGLILAGLAWAGPTRVARVRPPGAAARLAPPARPAQPRPPSRLPARALPVPDSPTLRSRADADWNRTVERLRASGVPEGRARRLASLWDARFKRLRQIRDRERHQRIRDLLESRSIAVLVAGVKPAFLAIATEERIADIRRALSPSFPRLRYLPIPSKAGPVNQVLIYDPAAVLAAMRRATASGLPAVSFAAELADFGAGSRSWDGLDAWLASNRDAIRVFSDHRIGIILGFPPRDVAGFMANPDGPTGWANATVRGEECGEAGWLCAQPDHPETRAAREAYGAAMELGASVLGLP